jgi:hypothetical protein
MRGPQANPRVATDSLANARCTAFRSEQAEVRFDCAWGFYLAGDAQRGGAGDAEDRVQRPASEDPHPKGLKQPHMGNLA